MHEPNTHLEDGLLTILFNRPEKLNALSEDCLLALNNIIQSAKTEPAVKAILISGTGKAFCAGADIQRLALCDTERGYQFAMMGQRVFRELETLGKPSLAAINGYALGGGCELAMATTLRIASDHAQFGQPEIKLGIIPGYGGTQRLMRLVGKGRALDLCLTGRTIDAETAYAWGLVTEVVPASDLLTRAKQIIQHIIQMPTLAVNSLMHVMDMGFDLPLTEALHLEALHFARLCATKDKQEGVQAFLEKRPALFSGI